MRRPGDNVDRGLVECKIENLLPAILFPPDKNLSVVPCRCEDVAVLGVRPRNAPNCSLVTVRLLSMSV